MDYKWIYDAIEYYKNNSENWIKELWLITEKYCNEHVLPLLVFHPLTDDDKVYILYTGFKNILNYYTSKRAINLPEPEGIFAAIMRENLKKTQQDTPLDKTDIKIHLFGAFQGFTFMAIKSNEISAKRNTELSRYHSEMEQYVQYLENKSHPRRLKPEDESYKQMMRVKELNEQGNSFNQSCKIVMAENKIPFVNFESFKTNMRELFKRRNITIIKGKPGRPKKNSKF